MNILIVSILSVILVCVNGDNLEYLRDEYGTLNSKADFYDAEFLQGRSTSLETRGPCKNLPTAWRKKPMSVDTRGTCFNACDDVDCTGNCRRIYPPNGEQQLSTIGWSRKIVSIKGCFYKGKAPVNRDLLDEEE